MMSCSELNDDGGTMMAFPWHGAFERISEGYRLEIIIEK